MPGVPEFIALPKAKEMFALSSWRDSPGLRSGGAVNAAGTQPSPLTAAADALRGGSWFAFGSNTIAKHGDSSPAACAAHGMAHPIPSPLPANVGLGSAGGLSGAAATATAGADGTPHRAAAATTATAAGSEARGSRKQRGGKASSPQQQQQQLDVDDFFLHVFLPAGVAYQTFAFEVQAQASPLHMMDVGLPIVLFPRRGKEGSAAAPPQSAVEAAAATAAVAVANDGREGGDAVAHNGTVDKAEAAEPAAAGMRLSPFATPYIQPVHRKTAKTGVAAALPSPLEEEGGHKDGDADDGGFLLPPAEHTVEDGAGGPAGGEPGKAAVTGPPSPMPNKPDSTASTAATTANGSGGGVEERYQASLLFAEREEAEKAAAFIKRHWPTAVSSIVPRNRSLLNASLVLKGLPSMNKTEYILEELEKLPNVPSYVRVHRGERGVYKNVVFVKYADRAAAEDCKVRLERILVGSRPLKVEFKKKSKMQGSDSAAAAAAAAVTVSANGNLSHNHNPNHGSSGANGGGGGAGAVHVEDDDAAAVAGADQVALQQVVRELRVSTEHEGFAYKREELTKGELKLLKQLCQSYGLLFEMTETKVTVRRALGGSPAPGMHSAGPSPALRPHMPPATPAWVPATPAPLRPMDFKGISHWKDIRGQQSSLGIIRPIGPEDGWPAFSAGRGRPV